jgi:hypothetical protein
MELIAAWHVDHGRRRNGKPFDYRELERWTRVGFEWGMRSPKANGRKLLHGGLQPP